jgi:hypothetical protein
VVAVLLMTVKVVPSEAATDFSVNALKCRRQRRRRRSRLKKWPAFSRGFNLLKLRLDKTDWQASDGIAWDTPMKTKMKLAAFPSKSQSRFPTTFPSSSWKLSAICDPTRAGRALVAHRATATRDRRARITDICSFAVTPPKTDCCNFCKRLFLKAAWLWVDRNTDIKHQTSVYAQSNQKTVP